MNRFTNALLPEIPLGEASAYFIKLKYASKGPQLDPATVMQDFMNASDAEKAEIMKEAGVTLEELNLPQEKTAASKQAFAENVLAGTEKYHSSRMLAMLQSMPAKVYTPEFSEKIAEDKKEPKKGIAHTMGQMAGVMGAPVRGLAEAFVHPAGIKKLKDAGKDFGKGVDEGSKFFHKKAAFKLALEQTPDIQQYLANEQQAMSAQNQNETNYMRDRMQQMQQQMTSAQQGQEATSQQMQRLEQQISESQQQIQLAQESAMQAQTLASQAQQGQLTATDESMRNAQLAAQMRMAYQQLRSSMMDLVSQDPAQNLADQLKGQAPGMLGSDTASAGQPPGQSPGQPATVGPPTPEVGPAGQAASPAAAPNAAPPEGERDANNANASGKDSKDKDSAAPNVSVSLKQANDQLLGALAGGVLGGGATAIEAAMGSGGAKQRVQKLEAQQGGGFLHALNLAQAKTRLAMSELAEKHPTAATITGSLLGAGIGASAAPDVRKLLSKEGSRAK